MAHPDRLPTPLSERLTAASLATFHAQGREVDLALGGIPFRLATTPEVPQTVETIPVRREQSDTENEPGERSLTSLWRRSQASWHGGAGDLYQESTTEQTESLTFHDSRGIDVFTPGQFKLLKRMNVWTNGVPPLKGSRIRTYASNYTRTNICTNPGFEVDLTGWSVVGGAGVSRVRDTARAHTGSASCRVDFSTTQTTQNVGVSGPALSVSEGTVFTVSARVWIPTGSTHVRVVSNGSNGSPSTLANQWQTISLTTTADTTGALQFSIQCVLPPEAGDQFYVDSVLIEESSIVGPYFDGTSTNAAWQGTAHLSASIETIVATDVSVSLVGDGKLYKAGMSVTPMSGFHAPAGKTIVDGVISGANFYDVASDGTLYEGLVAVPGAATTWPLGSGASRIGWGKHRLWVCGGRKIWQPNLALSGGTSQDPIFTHPNQGWTYTCMAEGSSAMLFGGHDGHTSNIQSVTLDTGGGLPTLSGASITAAMPSGELVEELSVLAGQYVGIGTNRGFRVGTVGESGQVTYGPLIVEPEGVLNCTALTSQGRFFVVAFRTAANEALAYRVDTGTPLDNLVFPHATDINCNFIGSISSLAAPSTTQLICTTTDGRTWVQDTSLHVDTGWLDTGRVRFRTTEPKTFRSVGVEIEPLQGNIQLTLIREGSSELQLGNITQQGETAERRYAVPPPAKMRQAAVRFSLNSTSDKLGTPIVHSYQLTALPAVKPQRLITLPLLCFDSEKALSGQWYGGKNYAADRLLALQLLEDDGELLLYEDFTSIYSGGMFVTIESTRFIQTSPNTSFKASTKGNGGIILVQLRTAEE